jgi:HEAT repeat protein
MKKVLLLLAAISLLWTYQASVKVADAHGGSYRGPAGEVPPGQRDPKDPQPPPENPGPTTGGGTGPTTGGPTGPGTGGGDSGTPPGNTPPGNPGPGGPVAPGGPGGTLTPGGGKKAAQPRPMSYDNWLFWWAYNKDEILNVKAAVKRNAQKISSKSSVFPMGGSAGNAGTKAPTLQKIQSVIVPALEKVVQNKDIHPDIRGGALIALARCRDSHDDHQDLFFKMAKKDNGEDKVVQESALIALGISQNHDKAVRDYLIKIVDDQDYPYRGRCFAMVSLGLLQDNSQEVIDCLERRLNGSEKTQDVPVCALLSIGLVGDNKVVPKLIDWLDRGRIGAYRYSELEKAWIISALGKIGDPRALKPVSEVLRRRGLYPVRSAMIAMGQIIPQADAKTQVQYMNNFVRAVEEAKDLTARNFGLIAIGRIANSKGVSEDIRKNCIRFLEKEFEKGNKVTERPFAALALGLVGFGKSAELRYSLADTIFRQFKELKGDKPSLGAQAIALGMLADNRKETVKDLISVLKDHGQDKKLRGSAAMALGLINDSAAKDAVMSALREREDRDLRVDTAVAAGLLGDSTAVPTLVNVLNDPRASQFVLGSVALALGQIGDQRAIEPLVKILEPGKVNGAYPDITRALVAVALGQIADQNDIRVLARISKDINYRASVPSLEEILTIL